MAVGIIGDNGYLYSDTDFSRIKEINEALAKYNPSINNDINSEVMPSDSASQKGNNSNSKIKQGLNLESRSVVSHATNLTGFSRKSGVSGFNDSTIETILSSSVTGKLPGESILK
jgi:hypothetical protein